MSFTFDQLIATKPRDSYSIEQNRNIAILSTVKKGLNPLNDYPSATPFGSATYQMQKYPGDLDLHEVFEQNTSIEKIVRKFEKIIKQIAKDIKKLRVHYFSEFKAGL